MLAAKEEETLFSQEIRAANTYYGDRLIDFKKGTRLYVKAESTLDKPITIKLLSNFIDDVNSAVEIGPDIAINENENSCAGLAWDDWAPFIGVKITVDDAPTDGRLNIYSVIQE